MYMAVAWYLSWYSGTCIVISVFAAHLQCQMTADKPDQPDGTPKESPDISMLSPELQQQWHVDSNRHLGAVKVKPKSRVQAVWECNKCPAGQPHVWTALVSSRTRGTQCPYCSNRRVCVHNSLATIAPEVATYWDRNKNENTPEQVLAGSNSRAEWKCPGCNHEWKTQIFYLGCLCACCILQPSYVLYIKPSYV
ncbi:hypothetical protein ABBQ38_006429 [Trebouxia sp. C0009 RCD-2024]